jgi:hypothetical protein
MDGPESLQKILVILASLAYVVDSLATLMYGDNAELHIRGLMQNVRLVKQCEALPGVFFRRSETCRITNKESG